MAKSYAKWGGIILLVLGVVGLLVGNSFAGLNTELIEDVIHIVAGALLLYAGLRGTDAQAASWSRIFGVVFLLVGVVGFFSKNMFGLLPAVGLSTLDNIVHLAYGVVGLWAARGYKMA
jgi:hypothetical protein